MSGRSPPKPLSLSLESLQHVSKLRTRAGGQVLRGILSLILSGTILIFGTGHLCGGSRDRHLHRQSLSCGGNQVALTEGEPRPHPDRTECNAIVVRNHIHPKDKTESRRSFDWERNQSRSGPQFLRGINLPYPRKSTNRIIGVLCLQPTSWHSLAQPSCVIE